jgi:hypothetical protein
MNTEVYLQLLYSFPPRPVDTDEQYETTEKIVKSYIGKRKSLEEKLYLEVLIILLYTYKRNRKDHLWDLWDSYFKEE